MIKLTKKYGFQFEQINFYIAYTIYYIVRFYSVCLSINIPVAVVYCNIQFDDPPVILSSETPSPFPYPENSPYAYIGF